MADLESDVPSGAGAGVLVVVGTPIGNLGDLSPRAADALASAAVIACEDTRRTGALLDAAGIAKRSMLVVNDHTEISMASRIIDRLAAGDTVALVSDAGMPTVSDPGADLVAAVLAAGHAVDVIPGPTAATTALAASGLPSGRWVFEGFLPRKGADRTARLAALAGEERTVVLYEAPHRIARTVADLAEVAGADRPVAVGRELTKKFQEFRRGPVGVVAETIAAAEPRGEYVIILGGAAPPPAATDDDVLAAVEAARADGMSTRDAVHAVADAYRLSKRRVYDIATGA